MAVNNITHKKITNQHFETFIVLLTDLLNLNKDEILSDLKEASLDDSDKNNIVYLYNGEKLNMDTVKLDDITKSFLKYMRNKRKQNEFEQPSAVDAVCVDKNNDWFLIEFKNRPICRKNSFDVDYGVVSDIKKKMLESLWLLFSMESMSNTSIFSSDITEFARNHITYITVISRDKNPQEYFRIKASINKLYTPNYLKKYIGYYFKDVYMISETELPKFIKEFKY